MRTKEEDKEQRREWWQALLVLAQLPSFGECLLYGARRHIAADLNLQTTPSAEEIIRYCKKNGIKVPSYKMARR
jgi:hypothetical protein